MGRWSQRRISGGGPSTSGPSITIIAASVINSATVFVQFSTDVTAAAFSGADFISSPSGAVGGSVSQSGTDGIELDMSTDPTGDTQLDYSGSTPNVVTPQSVLY